MAYLQAGTVAAKGGPMFPASIVSGLAVLSVLMEMP